MLGLPELAERVERDPHKVLAELAAACRTDGRAVLTRLARALERLLAIGDRVATAMVRLLPLHQLPQGVHPHTATTSRIASKSE